MTRIRTSLLCLTGLLLAGCASTPQTRIEKNPAAYNALPASQKNLVVQGMIKEGMSTDAVYIAWGSPSAITRGSKGGKRQEKWVYNGYHAVWTDPYCGGFGYYGGYRGYYGRHIYYAPTVDYIPVVQRIVTFTNGYVTEWLEID